MTLAVDSNTLPGTVLVAGAGIIGLSVALRLHLDGHRVVLVDSQQPMSGCSSGNAGYLSQANIFPPVNADVLTSLPRLMLSRTGPLVVRPRYLPTFVPWAWRALRTIQPTEAERVRQAMGELLALAPTAFDELLSAAGASELMDRQGGLVTFHRENSLRAKRPHLVLWRDLGLRAEEVSRSDVLDMEPALSPKTVGGIFFPGAARCLNPRRLGELYLQQLQAGGVVCERQALVRVRPNGPRVLAELAGGRSIKADHAVLCMGAQSDAVTLSLGMQVPMASERGYHLMLPTPGLSLRRPVVFGEPHFAATSMEDGLRLAGTAEYAHPDAPPAMNRAHMLLDLAKTYLPGLQGDKAVPWMGVRPSLPDGMPAIGRSTLHRGLLYAFGHGHNGLTTSAVTAQCISALIAGRAPPVPIEPFSLQRFC